MIIKSLSISNFRNHSSKSFSFNPGINVISGPNTSGKTNIVEAVYYLSLARSFRGADDEDLVAHNAEYAEILAEKKKLYGEYREAKKEMQDIQRAKYNIDQFLRDDEEQKKERVRKHNITL